MFSTTVRNKETSGSRSKCHFSTQSLSARQMYSYIQWKIVQHLETTYGETLKKLRKNVIFLKCIENADPRFLDIPFHVRSRDFQNKRKEEAGDRRRTKKKESSREA